MIQFTDHAQPEFDLDDFKTVEEVVGGIRRMRLVNGATRTDKTRVLQYLSSTPFQPSISAYSLAACQKYKMRSANVANYFLSQFSVFFIFRRYV